MGQLTAEKAALEATIANLESQNKDSTTSRALWEQQQQLVDMRIAKVHEQVVCNLIFNLFVCAAIVTEVCVHRRLSKKRTFRENGRMSRAAC